ADHPDDADPVADERRGGPPIAWDAPGPEEIGQGRAPAAHPQRREPIPRLRGTDDERALEPIAAEDLVGRARCSDLRHRPAARPGDGCLAGDMERDRVGGDASARAGPYTGRST